MKRFKYSMDHLDTRPLEWGPNDWVNNVPRVEASREVGRLVEEISRHTANVIIREANRNPMRVGHYNMMSDNDFRNAEFEALVQFICDRIEVGMFLDEISDPARGVERIIETCVTLSMSSMAGLYDEPAHFVEKECDRETYEETLMHIGIYTNLHKAIRAMYDGRSVQQVADLVNPRSEYERGRDRHFGRDNRDHRDNRGYSQDNRGGMRPRESGSRGGYARESVGRREPVNRGYTGSGFAPRAQSSGYQRQNRPTEVMSRQEQALYGSTNRYGVHEVRSNAFSQSNGDWDGPVYVSQNEDYQAQQEQSQYANRQENDNHYAQQQSARHQSYSQPAQGQRFTPRPSQVGTRPSREAMEIAQEHMFSMAPPPPPPAPPKPAAPPAPPPEQKKEDWWADEDFLYTPSGEIPLLIKKGQTEMDVLNHSRPYFEGGSNRTPQGESVARVLSLAQALGEENVTPEEIKDSVIVEKEPSLHPNLASLVTDVTTAATIKSMKEAGPNENGQRKILHRAAIVHTSVVGHKHLTAFHKRIRSLHTLTEVLNALRTSVEDAMNSASPEDAYVSDICAAADLYDRLVTREINTYCTKVLKLGKGDTVITSAMEDISDLFRYMMSNGYAMHADALRGFLHRMNVNMIDGWSQENSDMENAVRIDAAGESADDESVGLAFVAQSFNVTHIPYTLKELGYDMSKVDAIHTRAMAPLLMAALDISDTDLVKDPLMNEPGRILITRDRNAYRVFKVPSKPDSIVLSKIELN